MRRPHRRSALENYIRRISVDRWARNGRRARPSGAPLEGIRFLGEFSNHTVKLSLNDLPIHNQLTLSFELFILKSWDGSDTLRWGPDRWQAGIEGGPELLDTTFSNQPIASPGSRNNVQAFGGVGGNLVPAFTGAADSNSLGYSFYRSSMHERELMDSVYHLSFTFPHTGGSIVLYFRGVGLQGVADESWGIDNVKLISSAPIAYDDSYHVMKDDVLSTDASNGLLANDHYSTGSAPLIDIVERPSHGTFSFRPDGGFDYRPETGFVGMDRILYNIRDANGGGESPVAEAALFALAAPVPFTSINGDVFYDNSGRIGNRKPVRGARVDVYGGGLIATRLATLYTDDRGHFSLRGLLGAPYSNMTFYVFTQTRPAGTGAEEVKRAIKLTQETNNVSSYTEAFYPYGQGPYEGNIEAQLTIGKADNVDRAFWVFDALITATRFHARLPGVQLETVKAVFPTVFAPTSYTVDSTVHINGSDFDDWDTIIHEYGHLVAFEGGFFPFNKAQLVKGVLGEATKGFTPKDPPLRHEPEVNLRLQYPKAKYEVVTKVAFSEGWANFYSMVAQLVEGVSSPAVKGTVRGDAGDNRLYNYTVEAGKPLQPTDSLTTSGTSGFSAGADEELTVMRILWDLYDSNNPTNTNDILNGRQMDRDELGYSGLYELIKSEKVTSLLELFSALKNRYATFNGVVNYEFLSDFGAIYQLNNASPQPVAMRVNGRDTDVWNTGDPLPQFVFKLPAGWPGDTSDPRPALPSSLNSASVGIYDSQFRSVLTAIVPVDSPTSWTPTVAEWRTITNRAGGVMHWVVQGAFMEGSSRRPTGSYWSDAKEFYIR